MFIGILLTAFISLTIGGFGVSALFYYGTLDDGKKNETIESFVVFWFFMGALWFLVGAADIMGLLQLFRPARLITYAYQLVLAFALVIAAWHVDVRLFRSLQKKFIISFYIILAVMFIVSLFYYGFEQGEETFFARRLISSRINLLIFVIMLVPILAPVVVSAVRTIILRRWNEISGFAFRADVSLILLGIAGALDEMGLIANWSVTFIRLITLVGAIMAFLAVESLSRSDELIV